MDVMLREFGRYVTDAHRTACFARAIAEQVRPGDVVVDLGTGFGLLALLAVRAGARRVYAIEQGPYVELARAIARDNGCADRITFLAGNSAALAVPEPADVVVSETLGQFALEEYTVEYLRDALARFAKPGARVVPSALELAVVPLESPALARRWAAAYGAGWEDVAGFDLRRLRQAALANEALPYVVVDPGAGDRALGPAARLARFALGSAASSRFGARVRCTVAAAGRMDGWLGTFRVRLSPSVELTTQPSAVPTHWRQVVFPLVPACPVRPGDVVSAEIGFHGGAGWSFVPSAPVPASV